MRTLPPRPELVRRSESPMERAMTLPRALVRGARLRATLVKGAKPPSRLEAPMVRARTRVRRVRAKIRAGTPSRTWA
eukprot:15390476-Heterocapsa_arctica.AAC.1